MQIKQFDNQMMHSNCYIIIDDAAKHCIVVDPASEKSLNEISFINEGGLTLEYIILTHEHTDHTWGVNALIDTFPNVKVLATQDCKNELPKADQAYFRLYMDDPNYEYHVRRVDVTTEELNWELNWHGQNFRFIHTPGHSISSMCFSFEDVLFSGDTIMQFKKMYINKKTGSWVVWKESVEMLKSQFPEETKVMPGHGEGFCLFEYELKK